MDSAGFFLEIDFSHVKTIKTWLKSVQLSYANEAKF